MGEYFNAELISEFNLFTTVIYNIKVLTFVLYPFEKSPGNGRLRPYLKLNTFINNTSISKKGKLLKLLNNSYS